MQAFSVPRFALHEDAGDTDLVEKVCGQWNGVARGEHNVRMATLIGDKEQRRACGDAELGTEGMIVGVGVGREKAIGVGEFAAKGDRVARQGLSGEEIDISLLCQGLRFCQVKDQRLNFREWQAVQTVSVAKLKRR